MLVVDASVWIDYFRDAPRPHVDTLDELLHAAETRIVVPDLVLFEVLRGFRYERDHRQAMALLSSCSVESTGGADLALAASGHYRSLRARGRTVRSVIDVLVAGFCIDRGYALLHADRDFDAFESLRGLLVWPL